MTERLTTTLGEALRANGAGLPDRGHVEQPGEAAPAASGAERKRKTWTVAPQSLKDEVVRRVLAAGNERGAQARVAREMAMPAQKVSQWVAAYQRANGANPALSPRKPQVASSLPVPTVSIPGLQEYIEALIDERLEQVVEHRIEPLMERVVREFVRKKLGG